ncbi:MAG: hypothetical protein ACRDCN_15575 [Tannerellaceae bacterium]
MRSKSGVLVYIFSFVCGVAHPISKASIDSIHAKSSDAGVFFFPSFVNLPKEIFFTKPIYFIDNQKQSDDNNKGFLNYARMIIDNNYPTGIFILDETVFCDEKNREVDNSGFHKVMAITDSLHIMGFDVMLRICPLTESNRIQKNLKARLDKFYSEYKFDGFLFDLGKQSLKDIEYLLHDSKIYSEFMTQNKREGGEIQSSNSPLCLARYEDASFNIQLNTEGNTWNLLSCLISKTIDVDLQQMFAFPDIIDDSCFTANVDSLDQKSMVRLCQMQSMMPIIQFPLILLNVLDPKYKAICGQYLRFHGQMKRYLLQLALHSFDSKIPMIQHMDQVFPNQGFSACTNQFMLGAHYLVAPVVTSGNRRIVRLPKGIWRDDEGAVFKGPKILEIEVPINRLPFYERIN